MHELKNDQGEVHRMWSVHRTGLGVTDFDLHLVRHRRSDRRLGRTGGLRSCVRAGTYIETVGAVSVKWYRQSVTQPHKGGRPRDDATNHAILTAAYDELQDVGFRAVAMERIAKRAGSSKSTLYRWWPSKAAILLEAVNGRADRYPNYEDTGDVYVDLAEEIRGVIKFYLTDSGAAMLDLIAESRFDPDLADAIRNDFIARRRAATRVTWRRGVTSGRLRHDVNVEVVMDALWGSLYYKLLVSRDLPDVGFADQLMHTFWPAIAAASPT